MLELQQVASNENRPSWQQQQQQYQWQQQQQQQQELNKFQLNLLLCLGFCTLPYHTEMYIKCHFYDLKTCLCTLSLAIVSWDHQCCILFKPVFLNRWGRDPFFVASSPLCVTKTWVIGIFLYLWVSKLFHSVLWVANYQMLRTTKLRKCHHILYPLWIRRLISREDCSHD